MCHGRPCPCASPRSGRAQHRSYMSSRGRLKYQNRIGRAQQSVVRVQDKSAALGCTRAWLEWRYAISHPLHAVVPNTAYGFLLSHTAEDRIADAAEMHTAIAYRKSHPAHAAQSAYCFRAWRDPQGRTTMAAIFSSFPFSLLSSSPLLSPLPFSGCFGLATHGAAWGHASVMGGDEGDHPALAEMLPSVLWRAFLPYPSHHCPCHLMFIGQRTRPHVCFAIYVPAVFQYCPKAPLIGGIATCHRCPPSLAVSAAPSPLHVSITWTWNRKSVRVVLVCFCPRPFGSAEHAPLASGGH